MNDCHWLKDKRVALVGRFGSLSHEELRLLIEDCGGAWQKTATRHTDLVVVGEGGLPLESDALPSECLQKVSQWQTAGYPIEVIAERQFWERIDPDGDDQQIRRRYTIADLSRLLEVPRDRLRSWARAGLIVPEEVRHRLPRFDLTQAQRAKTLCQLLNQGITLTRIRDSLEQLRRLLPSVAEPLAQVAVLDDRKRILFRDDQDRLVEPSGQYCFDFHEPDSSIEYQRPIEQLFEEAVELEDARRYPEASALYEAALRREPDDPVLWFNLANVQFYQGQYASAEESYRKALALDASYAEAWNNLGGVLALLERYWDALQAFQKTLELVPDYADAHYNLADLLETLGRSSEARRHWRRYLQLDDASPWATHARERLGVERAVQP